MLMDLHMLGKDGLLNKPQQLSVSVASLSAQS